MDQASNPAVPSSSPPPSPGKSPYPSPFRSGDTSVSKRDTPDGARSLVNSSPSPPKLRSRQSGESQQAEILSELNRAIGQALNGLHQASEGDSGRTQPPEGHREADAGLATELQSPSPAPSNRSSVAGRRYRHHKRASSETSQTSSSPRHRQHRPVSTSEVLHTPKAPRRPAFSHKRSFSQPSVVVDHQNDGKSYLPSHAETHMALDVDKMRALISRNRPLPRACMLKQDLSVCRGAGERAVMYAKKINELSVCESGLAIWIAQIKQAVSGKSI